MPQRFGTGVLQIVACEPDVREHAVVAVRKVQKLPAMSDGYGEVPGASRQRSCGGDHR